MRRYLSVYITLLKLNFATLTAYRSNFVNSIFSTIAWGMFSIIATFLLTARTPVAFGWRREEIILLAAAFNILIGVFHALFSRNFERLSRLVNFGQLDRVLLQPIDSQFLVSLWEVNYANLLRVFIGAGLMLFLIEQLNVAISFGDVLAFALLLLVGLILLYSIWLCVATLTIWFTRLSNIVDLMYSVTGMARYPQEMFRQLADYIFFFLLPITLIIVTPTKALLARATTSDVLLLFLCAFGLLYIGRKFWQFALRSYTSASS